MIILKQEFNAKSMVAFWQLFEINKIIKKLLKNVLKVYHVQIGEMMIVALDYIS